ncbi:MAG: hypothetical protein JW761_04290 [Prolixibacteraceae bacterium]|nr:hypothetical protein [Prolixibacteraceae bacterium]
MSEFDAFLSRLSDHELAIFYGYRYNGFLENSQKKIDREIGRRNLGPEKLKALKDRRLSSLTAEEIKTCPRCGSGQLFVESDFQEIPVTEFSSAEIAVDSMRCRLCGYNAGKATPGNFFEKIKQIFGRRRNRRINKWNEL